MQILDEFGLPDLTMRRLAAALDVQPSALYWHFPNKQSLLAELSDRIVAPIESSPRDGEWPDRVAGTASALRRALLAHRDGAEVVTSTFALGLGSPLARDQLARAVAAGGFEPDVASTAATALLHFVLGHVLHEQQRRQYDSLGFGHGDETPQIRSSDAEFTFGVDLFIGGLRLRLLET